MESLSTGKLSAAHVAKTSDGDDRTPLDLLSLLGMCQTLSLEKMRVWCVAVSSHSLFILRRVHISPSELVLPKPTNWQTLQLSGFSEVTKCLKKKKSKSKNKTEEKTSYFTAQTKTTNQVKS